MIILGDCIEKMKDLEENSIDALITDSPYGLAFMSKDWDSFKPRAFQEFSLKWGEQALRILKPGALLSNFSGTRTYHRMVCGLEDAGFLIKDQLLWMYGSGFPKSLNISKAIEKNLGVKPLKKIPAYGRIASKELIKERGWNNIHNALIMPETQTIEAKKWEGWGTALKPAFEPIVLAQKPYEKTYAKNILKWSVGGLNIDACRIKTTPNDEYDLEKRPVSPKQSTERNIKIKANDPESIHGVKNKGRYPSNILLTHHPECKLIGIKEVGTGKTRIEGNKTPNLGRNGIYGNSKIVQGTWYGSQNILAYDCHPDCPIILLDEQSGELGNSARNNLQGQDYKSNGMFKGGQFNLQHDDKGGASRFFYSGKAYKSERNAGLEELDHVDNTEMVNRKEGSAGIENPRAGAGRGSGAKNNIATLKPINLMRYLVRLICPKGGTVLDPFAGSGTTGIACIIEGMNYILIEKRKRFTEIIIPKRLKYWSNPKNWEILNDHNSLPKLKDLKNKRQNRDILSYMEG